MKCINCSENMNFDFINDKTIIENNFIKVNVCGYCPKCDTFGTWTITLTKDYKIIESNFKEFIFC